MGAPQCSRMNKSGCHYITWELTIKDGDRQPASADNFWWLHQPKWRAHLFGCSPMFTKLVQPWTCRDSTSLKNMYKKCYRHKYIGDQCWPSTKWNEPPQDPVLGACVEDSLSCLHITLLKKNTDCDPLRKTWEALKTIEDSTSSIQR